MEISRDEWKQVLAPVKTSELEKILQDIDPRIWEDPRETSTGRIKEMGLDRKIQDWIQGYDNPTILELGSGPGYTTQEIQEKFPEAEVYGVDVLDDFSQSGTHVQGTALNLPFQQSSFDLVIAPNSVGLLEYKNIATRAGGRLAKTTDLYQENIEDLDADGKSTLNTNARFEGGKAYNELFTEKTLDEAAYILTEEGKLAIADGENHLVAENAVNGWQVLEDEADEDDRYNTWQQEMNRYSSTTENPSIAEHRIKNL